MTYTLRREIPKISDYINIRVAAGVSRKSASPKCQNPPAYICEYEILTNK